MEDVDLEILKVNNLHCRINADRGILLELEEKFSYFVAGYKYMAKWKMGVWDGKIKLFRLHSRTLYIGLVKDVISYCEESGYAYRLDPTLKPINLLPELKEYVRHLSDISVFQPYPYQLSAFVGAIVENRSLILSPTASGKSLIFYLIIRFLLEHTSKKILLVVPTVSLVEQAVSDMQSYDPHDEIEAYCHKIYSGRAKESDARVFVTTWHSIYKLPVEWFEKFDTVIIDEAHQADAASLTGILEKLPDVLFRVGLTGTLDGTKTHELFMRGIFGKLIRTTTTANLMKQGLLSKLEVQVLKISYPKEDRKIVSKMKYQDEVLFLTKHEKRNDLLVELSLSQEGNVLVLFNFIAGHGDVLFEKAQALAEAKEKSIYFVSGKTEVEVRENTRSLIEQHDNIVIFASYGVFSTGINMKNLRTVIFAHPFKSRIRNLQSIGRGLRLAEGKTKAVLIDVCDDLTYNKRHNLVYNHAIERVKIYESEKFEYRFDEYEF